MASESSVGSMRKPQVTRHSPGMMLAAVPPLVSWPAPRPHVRLSLHDVWPAWSWYWPGSPLLVHALQAVPSAADAATVVRQVATAQGQSLADEDGMKFFETSARTGVDGAEAVLTLATDV